MSVRILQGDCREKLAELPAESVHCVVTSPPYWGLRDYGVEGAMGLEPTVEEHVATLVDVFREVRRVLRKDGTVWLNYGDTYHNGDKGGYHGQRVNGDSMQAGNLASDFVGAPNRTPQKGLKPKDLVLMHARIALALQEDGWWLRSGIIWHKPNPMPESVQDRPTQSHEHVYLLTKSRSYFYDPMGYRLPFTGGAHARRKDGQRSLAKGHDPFDRRATWVEPAGWDTGPGSHGSIHKDGRRSDKQRGHSRRHAGFNDRWDAMNRAEQQVEGANLRTVWSVATHPFPDAHFATFPPEIPERCIRLGTSEKGACSRCGAPWIRKVVETEKPPRGESTYGSEKGQRLLQAVYGARGLGGDHDNPFLVPITLGWRPGCDCDAGVAPCMVLDPFAGVGTTGLVADRLGRDAVLVELNPEYVEMARKRIQDDAPLLTEVV